MSTKQNRTEQNLFRLKHKQAHRLQTYFTIQEINKYMYMHENSTMKTMIHIILIYSESEKKKRKKFII